MNYWQIRKMFAERSGRYDLVNADWTDNGADFFFSSGQRLLDRMAETGKMVGKYPQLPASGETKIYYTGLRAVKEVWAGKSTEGLIKLEKKTLSALREYYEKQVGSVDVGQPLYYAPAYFRPIPDNQASAGWASFYDVDDLILADTHYPYSGVIIAPPTDGTYYVSLVGKFYSPELTATFNTSTGVWTQTKSFWSEVHPDILLLAALFKLETFYRNTEGAKDWKGALDLDLRGMDFDAAEEDLADTCEMEG
jgi:hypothetical protein